MSGFLKRSLSGLFDPVSKSLRGLMDANEVEIGPMAYVLAQSAVPRIILSSATNITATGLITGLTALPYTPSGVVQVYCFAQTGLASGWYAATFSSATSCQIYTDAAGTVTPTGITAGAYAGGTTQINVPIAVIPGGAMGPNGVLRGVVRWAATNNANTKTVTVGVASFNVITALTSFATGGHVFEMRNRGSQSVNVWTPSSFSGPYGGSTNAPLLPATDTSVNQNFNISMQLGTATDYLICEGYTLEIVPGG